MEGYRTIAAPAQEEFVEKRSRFIGQIAPVEGEEEALAFINAVRERHREATHNVYAYILRENQMTRFSDDGEPQGTAGKPVLEVVQREGLVDVAVVVTRYFGGVLLGAGGLVRAYTQSAKSALDGAGISVVRRWVEALLPCPYSWHDRVRLEIERLGGTVAETDYGADVCFTVLLPEERAQEILDAVLDLSAGQIEGIVSGERFQDVPWRERV